MSPPRATLVVSGQVVVEARPDGPRTAGAIGIADGRVVAVGEPGDVLAAAAPGARHLAFGEAAVVPGVWDFHLHLVGMARARREVQLDDAATADELLGMVRAAADRLPAGEWLRGRGWREAVMGAVDTHRLDALLGERPALLYSHDGHSAWASAEALHRAGVSAGSGDPGGGRIERDAAGRLTGVLRERATDLVEPSAGRLRGVALDEALAETLAELAGLGVTSVVDAGDTSTDGGTGPFAALGDRASALLSSDVVDGRCRVMANVPADGIAAAESLALRSGEPLPGRRTVRVGWAKVYIDGALGSQTAAVFSPYTCGAAGDTGIARLTEDELAAIVAAARASGISLAVHAIGDRGAALVLDALEHAPAAQPGPPPDRMEHLQLLRPQDAARLARLGVTASLQPIHCASDRELAEACWADRLADTYPWRTLADAGTRLAFGSDAPIESPNPWLGIFAAVHRRFVADGTPDWQPAHALRFDEALTAYTRGAAQSAGDAAGGSLDVGAMADLAVLNVDLATLRAADERLRSVRSQLTLLAGEVVHSG
jgi:predicted amidohydrolase YtcJ